MLLGIYQDLRSLVQSPRSCAAVFEVPPLNISNTKYGNDAIKSTLPALQECLDSHTLVVYIGQLLYCIQKPLNYILNKSQVMRSGFCSDIASLLCIQQNSKMRTLILWVQSIQKIRKNVFQILDIVYSYAIYGT